MHNLTFADIRYMKCVTFTTSNNLLPDWLLVYVTSSFCNIGCKTHQILRYRFTNTTENKVSFSVLIFLGTEIEKATLNRRT
jgi:hypothetical protein